MTQDEQVRSVAAFGFTARQAGFLVAVMRHSGVCLARQYCAYAAIARGQKTHDFFGSLVARRYATVHSAGPRHARLYHVHHKGLYRAIGEPDARFRKPLAVARAVERLMVLDHVLAHRDLRWLAGEREKVEYFTGATELRRDELPSLTFGQGTTTTTRYFPDKLPIGVSADRRRHVFLYLVTQDVPLDFRAFLYRHAELLRALADWEIRLLIPRHLSSSTAAYQEAFREELGHPLRRAVADELAWYFRQLKAGAKSDGTRLRQAQQTFAAARYRALYRAWQRDGDQVLHATTSPILADRLARRSGRLECHVPANRYLHLTPLVGTA
jgi:hypothetical protein